MFQSSTSLFLLCASMFKIIIFKGMRLMEGARVVTPIHKHLFVSSFLFSVAPPVMRGLGSCIAETLGDTQIGTVLGNPIWQGSPTTRPQSLQS